MRRELCNLSLLEILWITIVSMGIVFVMLTILMFLMQGSSKVIQILEAKSHPTAGVVGKPVEVKPEAPTNDGTLFETNKLDSSCRTGRFNTSECGCSGQAL